MTATCPVCGAEQHESLLCHACTTTLERALGDVPSIVADLDVTVSRMSRIGTSGKGGLASEKTPIHLGAVQVADDLANTLTTWARDVSPDERWPIGDRHPANFSAAILLGMIDLIRRHPAVNELFDEITDAIKQARRVVDRPADRVYLGVCHYIEAEVECFEEVYAAPGADETRCRTCGITHEVAERRAWLLKRAEDMLFTVAQAAQMMGEVGSIRVTEASIRGYIHRGRIGYKPPGKLIRLGDLLTVLVDEGERRSA